MVDYSGVQCNRLKRLRRVLKSWVGTVHEYGKQVPGDDPWTYTERAVVSTLAGAVWKAGGVSLEEYQADKKKGRSEKPGRADLYFKLGKTAYEVEAKHMWLGIGRKRQTWNDSVNRVLNRARKDAKAISAYSGVPKLGVLFIRPYLKHTTSEKAEAAIRAWIEELVDFSGDVAWAFPKWARRNYSDDGKNKWLMPGVALIARRPPFPRKC